MSVSVMPSAVSTSTTLATTQAIEVEEELGPTLIKKLEVSEIILGVGLGHLGNN